jgi:hypothetical protein
LKEPGSVVLMAVAAKFAVSYVVTSSSSERARRFGETFSRFRSDYRRGFGWVNAFIDHLHTRLGTTSTYNGIADLQTLQIITH